MIGGLLRHKVHCWIWGCCSGAVGGTLLVQDEGVAVGTTAVLNFVGTGVLAKVDPMVPGRINIYIPPPAYSAAFSIDNVDTANRYVAAPGPYGVGTWNLSVVHPCLRTSPLTYTSSHPHSSGTFTINNNVSTTLRVRVYDSDNLSVLAENLLTLTGNANQNINNINLTIWSWQTEGDKFAARMNCSINLAAIMPQGGRFLIEFVHNNGSDGIVTRTQGPMFYDIEPAVQAISGLSIAENTVSSSKWLSGIRYYTIGDTFDIGIADLDNMNANSYPQPFVAVDSWGEYGIPNFDLNGSDLTGWTNAWNDVDDSYLGTHAITRPSFRYIGTAANITAQVTDWVAGASAASGDASVCIDTYVPESTQLAEYFTDEAYRRRWGFAGTEALWDSTQDMTAYDDNKGMMTMGGLLQTRYGDWNGHAPGLGANPDYTGFAGWGTYCRRFIDVAGLVRGSATMTISGFTVTDLVNSDVRMWIMIPGRWTSPCYCHGPLTFDFGTFNGDNDPIRTSDSAGGTLKMSFGALGLNATYTYFIMCIEIQNPAIRPDSIIVSW